MTLTPNDILLQATRRYGQRLHWYIRSIVVSHDDAEDALQETLIKIFTKADSLRGGEAALEAWCFKIATKEALMLLRKRKNLFQSLDSLSEELTDILITESAPDADRSELLFQSAILRLSV